jgi:hypothetical protein
MEKPFIQRVSAEADTSAESRAWATPFTTKVEAGSVWKIAVTSGAVLKL